MENTQRVCVLYVITLSLNFLATNKHLPVCGDRKGNVKELALSFCHVSSRD